MRHWLLRKIHLHAEWLSIRMHVHCCPTAACLCIHILTHCSITLAVNQGHISFRGAREQEDESRYVCSIDFISSRGLLLITFENLKEKSPLLRSNPANKSGWREREWLVDNGFQLQGEKILTCHSVVLVAEVQMIASSDDVSQIRSPGGD